MKRWAPCRTDVKMLSTVKKIELLNKFEEIFGDLYIKPESPQFLRSILQDEVIFKEGEVRPCQKIRKKVKPQSTTSSDIQKFFKRNNKNDDISAVFSKAFFRFWPPSLSTTSLVYHKKDQNQ